jgi:hypothetical protein
MEISQGLGAVPLSNSVSGFRSRTFVDFVRGVAAKFSTADEANRQQNKLSLTVFPF